jgi:hypothetical protein
MAPAHMAPSSVLVYSVQRLELGVEPRARHPHEVALGVAGAVAFGHDLVLGLEDDVAIGVDEQRAERVVAVRAPQPLPLRSLPKQKSKSVLGKGSLL